MVAVTAVLAIEIQPLLIFLACAKYVVLLLSDGVVYEVDPLTSNVPPVGALYQSIVSPVPAVADKITVPAPHLEAPVPVGESGIAFTVAVTGVLVNERQPDIIFLACA